LEQSDQVEYRKNMTGLVVIDPYNDFISEGGKVWDRLKGVAEANTCAHTCLEATVRFGAELGYEVTVVKDATASYSDVEMRAALEVNIPNYANAIVSTDEILNAISQSKD
jgi:nicotinamidase-related amidase